MARSLCDPWRCARREREGHQVRLSQARQGAAPRPQQGQSQGGRALLRSDPGLRPAVRQGQARAVRPRRDRRRRQSGHRRSAAGSAAAAASAAARGGGSGGFRPEDFEGLRRRRGSRSRRPVRRPVRRAARGGRGGGGRAASAAAAAPRRRRARAPTSAIGCACRSSTPRRRKPTSGSRWPTARRSTSSCPPGSRTARRCASRARASRVPAAPAMRW